MTDIDNEGTLNRYLLGEIDDVSRELIEQRLLVDAYFFERLEALEYLLISDHINQTLSASEQELFEKQLANDSALRRKVADARALKTALASIEAAPTHPPARPWSGPALWALAAAAMIAIIWLSVVNWRLREEQRSLLAKLGESGHASTSVGSLVADVTLSPGTLMGESKQRRILVRPQTKTLRIELEAAPKASKYRGIARDAEGREVWSGSAASPKLDLPTASFIDGDYVIRLESLNARGAYETVADYAFAVTRR